MGKEIIINARKDQTRIAIVENDDLAEMYFEDPDNERTLGDIYLGRVRRIMPSIQAAFIDIGQASDAFLHFSDIADNVGDMIRLLDMSEPDVGKLEISDPVRRRRPRGPAGTQVSMDDDEDHAEEEARQGKAGRQKRGNANGNGHSAGGSRSSGDGGSTFRPEDLKKDQKILVKIVKEPISSKGSRVSTDISLAGRFLVLVPLADYVAVSKKIVSYKERRRLRALAKSLLPKGFGLIVRTVAEEKNAKALDTDLRLLVEKWRRIEKRLAEVKNPPAVLHQDVNMVSSVIRDLFSDDYERILIDDQRVYKNVKGYIQAVAPQMAPAVKMHSDRKPIFQAAGIEKAVRQAFESRVDLPSGGYLIIEHTEAMHVIDVNSGRAGRGLSQEQNSLKVNLESARMIAQQLRLRDLGGIIVVDFIDLRDDKNRKKVYDELKKHFRKDRAVTKILPMSDFGLMQITRQRLRPSITTIKKTEDDRGKSAVAAPANVEQAPSSTPRMTPDEWREKLERWVVRYHEKGKRKPLTLRVHPFAKTYLGRGVARATLKWFWKYRIRVGVETDAEQNPLSFRFFDAESGNELTRRRRSGRRRGKKRSRDNRSSSETPGNRSERGSRGDSDKRSGGRDGKPEGKADSKSGGRSGSRSGRRSNERSGRSSGRSGNRASGNRPDSRPEKSDSGRTGRSSGRSAGGNASANTTGSASSSAAGNTPGNTSGNTAGRVQNEGSGGAPGRNAEGGPGRTADQARGRDSRRDGGDQRRSSRTEGRERPQGKPQQQRQQQQQQRPQEPKQQEPKQQQQRREQQQQRQEPKEQRQQSESRNSRQTDNRATGGSDAAQQPGGSSKEHSQAQQAQPSRPAPSKPASADNGTGKPEPAAAIKTTFSSHHRPEPEQSKDQ